MITFRLLLLVLVTLGCRELAEGNTDSPTLLSSLASLGISLGFGLLFKASALRVLSNSKLPLGIDCWERCLRARDWVERAWIVFLPAALLSTGWGAALNGLQEQGLPQSLALLGWFLPSLFLITLLELTAAQCDELLRQPSASPLMTAAPPGGLKAASQRGDTGENASWQSEWRLRLRLGDMASLLTCITPVVVIAAITDGVSYFADDLWMTRLILAGTLLALLTVVLFLPVWLGHWMGVIRLPDGDLSDRISRQLTELEIRGIRPKLLPSRGRWPGAAVVGWFPRFRQLWIGDALIDRLSPRELDMVVMHELAHVTRRHFLWRIFPMVWAAGILGLFSALWPNDPSWEVVGTGLSSILASIVMMVGLSRMAHTCELDADLSACSLARQACTWASDNPDAARHELSSALVNLLQDSSTAAEATWLHPNLQRRLENLRSKRS